MDYYSFVAVVAVVVAVVAAGRVDNVFDLMNVVVYDNDDDDVVVVVAVVAVAVVAVDDGGVVVVVGDVMRSQLHFAVAQTFHGRILNSRAFDWVLTDQVLLPKSSRGLKLRRSCIAWMG